jgi:hypothetical protein
MFLSGITISRGVTEFTVCADISEILAGKKIPVYNVVYQVEHVELLSTITKNPRVSLFSK